MPKPRKPDRPFRYFNSSPEIIRLVVMMYIRFPLSLRNVEDLLFKRGIDICHETVRLWWNMFGPLFAANIRRQRVSRMKGFRSRMATFGWKTSGPLLGGQIEKQPLSRFARLIYAELIAASLLRHSCGTAMQIPAMPRQKLA